MQVLQQQENQQQELVWSRTVSLKLRENPNLSYKKHEAA